MRSSRPQQVKHIGLRPSVDLTSTPSAITRTYAGVSDRAGYFSLPEHVNHYQGAQTNDGMHLLASLRQRRSSEKVFFKWDYSIMTRDAGCIRE